MTGYPSVYGYRYGHVYPPPFPQSPLPVQCDIQAGTWTDITTYCLQRDSTSPPFTITRGRPDERALATPSAMACQINNRDARFTAKNPTGPYFGLIGRNTPIRVSVPDQLNYLRIEDDSTSYAAAPAPAGLGVLSQDIRLDLALSGYSPCTLASWWGSGQRAWLIRLNADGSISFSVSPDGSAVSTARSTQPLPLGATCLRVTRDWASGGATFWTAPSGTITGSSWTQLGNVVLTGIASTNIWHSTAVISAGYNSTANADFGVNGLTGKVYDFLIYGAFGGSVVAQAAFSGQGENATSWTDAHGNAWAAGGSALISGRSYRYHGEMSSVPQQWDETGSDVWIPMRSGGLLRRYSQGNKTLDSALYRYWTRNLDVEAYWSCEDQAGAGSFASALGQAPMTFTGHPSLAASSAIPGSGAIPTLGGSTWSGLVQSYAPGTGNQVTFLLAVPSGGDNDGSIPFAIYTEGTVALATVRYDAAAGGSLTLSVWTVAESFIAATPSFTGANGALLAVRIQLQNDGAGNVNATMQILQAGQTTPSSFTASSPSSSTGITTRVVVNLPNFGLSTASGSAVGHIAAEASVSDLSLLASPLFAWGGENAGTRFARLCSEEGLQSRIYGYPQVTAGMGPQTQQTFPALLQECETADRGMIYEPAECLAFGYRTLVGLLNQSPAVTLDYSQAHIGDGNAPLVPVDDDQYTLNDYTASKASGSSFRWTLDDGTAMSISPPPSGVGPYASSGTHNLANESALRDVAGWIVHMGTVNEDRYPSVPLHLARAVMQSLIFEVQSARIGDVLEIDNPPAWLPPGAIHQVIAGTREELGGWWWTLAWNCVPATPYNTGIYDDPVYGRADTDGSQLTSAVTSTATSFQVSTTGPSGIIWTTLAADFPFDISVGGERMTVSVITGTGSPQTFHVTRSVNGVVKAHAAGEHLRLFTPSVLAIA